MANRDNDDLSEDRSGRQPSSWESFCREEAKQWASAFLDRVRRFKLRNAMARDVHDSTFTNEFSAAFLEESSLLMANENSHSGNSRLQALTMSMPSNDAHSTMVGRREISSSRKATSKAKSWWSHLFKWPRTRRTSGASAGSSSSGQSKAARTSTNVLKDGAVQMLNMNADNSTSSSAWQQCNLVLLEDHGNPQLKVYSPPKVSNLRIHAVGLGLC